MKRRADIPASSSRKKAKQRTCSSLLLKSAIVIVLLPILVFAQQRQTGTLSGAVSDDSTKAPIEGANVYVSGTTLGTISGKEGRFEITGVPLGVNEVVASMLGYSADHKTVMLTGSTAPPISFSLAYQTYVLSPQVIQSEFPKEWRENLEEFTRAFVGTSENASQCRIVNPEIIDFTRQEGGDVLEASANAPFEIENNGLGYRIFCSQLKFRLEKENVTYSLTAKFENLPSGDEATKLRWEKARLNIYKGSLRHFFTALFLGTLEKEGFVMKSVDVPRYSDLRLAGFGKIDDVTMVPTTSSRYAIEVNFPRYLCVVYYNRPEPREYTAEREKYFGGRAFPTDKMASWITLPAGSVTFDIAGVPQEPERLHVVGYWAWLRFADGLPRDYTPPSIDIDSH